MRKKLGICGDSFYAAIKEDAIYPGHGLHFTELLSKKLDWDLITFARGGCSNQAIRLQIDEIIKYKPDHVIIGTTSSDRIEIPYTENGEKSYLKKLFQTEGYKKENTIYNIDYENFADESSKHEGFETKPYLRSETIINILNGNINLHNKLSDDMMKSIEGYFYNMYVHNWKKQQDSWIIANGVHKLLENNINFTLVLNNLYVEDFTFCENNIIKDTNPLSPSVHWSENKNVPYPFHLTIEDEIMLSELWYNHLIERI